MLQVNKTKALLDMVAEDKIEVPTDKSVKVVNNLVNIRDTSKFSDGGIDEHWAHSTGFDNPVKIYNIYRALYEEFNITSYQKIVIANELELLFGYLVYLTGSTKKGNKLINRLLKLDTIDYTEDFSQDILLRHSDLKVDNGNWLRITLSKKGLFEEIDLRQVIRNLFDSIKENSSISLGPNQVTDLTRGAFYKNHFYYEIKREMDEFNYMREYSTKVFTNEQIHPHIARSIYNGDFNMNGFYKSRLMVLVSKMDYQLLTKLLDLLLGRGDIDLHDFLENLPTGFYTRLAGEHPDYRTDDEILSYQKRVLQFLTRLKGVNRADFLRIIKYMNYRKVNRAANIEIMNNHINYVEAAIARSTSGSTSIKQAKSEMLFHDSLEVENFPGIDIDTDIVFTKDIAHVNNIGSKTLCCFTPNGLAGPLVTTSIESPLAGILEGDFRRSRGTWFSFVWEMIEEEESGLFRSALIWDNLEASQHLPREEFEDHVKTVADKSDYRRMYIGDLRNDIEGYVNMMEDVTRKSRPHTLSGYESKFRQYGYDDSGTLRDLNQAVLNDSPVDWKIGSIKARPILTPGDWHRVLAVEKLVWGSNSDEDMNRIRYQYSPSFIITGDNDTILGYLVTRLVTRSRETGKIDFSYIHRELNDYKSIIAGDREDLVLLIEDIYLSDNRKILDVLPYLADNLIKYVNEHNIEYSSASPNTASASFIKKLEKYTDYIEDARLGEIPEERATTKRRKLSSNLFTDEVEYDFTYIKEGDYVLLPPEVEEEETEEEESEEDLYTYEYED